MGKKNETARAYSPLSSPLSLPFGCPFLSANRPEALEGILRHPRIVALPRPNQLHPTWWTRKIFKNWCRIVVEKINFVLYSLLLVLLLLLLVDRWHAFLSNTVQVPIMQKVWRFRYSANSDDEKGDKSARGSRPKHVDGQQRDDIVGCVCCRGLQQQKEANSQTPPLIFAAAQPEQLGQGTSTTYVTYHQYVCMILPWCILTFRLIYSVG